MDQSTNQLTHDIMSIQSASPSVRHNMSFSNDIVNSIDTENQRLLKVPPLVQHDTQRYFIQKLFVGYWSVHIIMIRKCLMGDYLWPFGTPALPLGGGGSTLNFWHLSPAKDECQSLATLRYINFAYYN